MNNPSYVETEFPATCFGPGLAPGGQRVAAHLTSDALRVALDDGREHRTPWYGVQISPGGFDHQQLQLSWRNGDEFWVITPADEHARTLLLSAAPPELQRRLKRWARGIQHTRRSFRAGWFVFSALLASPLLLLLLFWGQSERVVGWVVDQISLDTEQQLGKIVFAQVESTTPLIKEGPGVETIRSIGARLTAGSPYTYHWFIAQDKAVNAFAMPGGYIVVNSGLIQAADSAEEVAGVLAHEVQHVERRHTLKGMTQSLGLQALLSLVLGDVGNGVWGGIAGQLGTLQFGRNNESEADRLGLRALIKADVDPRGMLHFFEKLQKQEGPSITMLATHPASADRIAALRARVEKEATRSFVPLDVEWVRLKKELLGNPQ